MFIHRTKSLTLNEADFQCKLGKLRHPFLKKDIEGKTKFSFYKKCGKSHYGCFTFKIDGYIDNNNPSKITYQIKPCTYVILISILFFSLLVYAIGDYFANTVNLSFLLMAFAINVIFDLSVALQAYSCVQWFEEYLNL